MLNTQKVFLIAARRIGKTSLVKHILHDLKRKGVKGIYLDIEGITSYKRFLELYLTRVSQELSVGSKIISFIKKVLPGLGIAVSVEEDNSVSMTLRYQGHDDDLERTAAQIYELPAKAAGKKGFVVVFDEFQEITKLNGGHIAASLRASIQHQRNVGYIFAGSRRDLLMEMADSKGSPFFKIGPIMFLENIKSSELKEFILDKFRKTKVGITAAAADLILSVSDGIPYYTQMISFEAWEWGRHGKKVVDSENIPEIMDQLVKKHETYFREKWGALVLTQRKVLQVIARGDAHLMSKEIIERYELGALSTTQRAISQLKKDNLIDKDGEKHYVDDILFREWIRKYTT